MHGSRVRRAVEESPMPGHEPEMKRRKVRKGTQSCWECRRRKVRCVNTSTTSAVCDLCRQRSTSCVSQEFPDEPQSPTSGGPLEERLARAEALIEELIQLTTQGRHIYPDSSSNDDKSLLADKIVQSDHDEAPSPSDLQKVIDTSRNVKARNSEVVNSVEEAHATSFTTLSLPPSQNAISQHRPGSNIKNIKLNRELREMWPTENDLQTILSMPVGISSHVHVGIRAPYPDPEDKVTYFVKDTLRLPPLESQPILTAYRLLVLASYMQSIPPYATKDRRDLATNYRQMMSQIVETVTRLVTTQHDLIDSVEGVESVMVEAMYYNYAGKFRQAWQASRRAVSVAQMLGLHQGRNASSLKFIEPEKKDHLDAEHMWFRLVSMDRYLSLMLGLPQASLEDSFASSSALARCTPRDRMQRLYCVAGSRILQRNDSAVNDLKLTAEIDASLQKASAEMPAQKWLIPDFTTAAGEMEGGRADVMEKMLCLVDQLTYHHLLTRLHLPYMLRHSADGRYDYSKITAVNASREVLSRYIVFRASNPLDYYCRGMDFLSLVASTIMCLAHIEAHRHRIRQEHTNRYSNTFSYLTHQRLGDRGLMERTLDIIQSMAKEGDVICSNVSRILRPLLKIESDAAKGVNMDIKLTDATVRDDKSATDHGDMAVRMGEDLRIDIPYFGTLMFRKHEAPRSSDHQQAAREQNASSSLPSFTTNPGPQSLPLLVESHQDQIDQVPTSSPPHQPFSVPTLATSGEIRDFDMGNAIFAPSYDANLTGELGDLDLQGVDLALFGSLFGGVDMEEGLYGDIRF